MRPLAQIYLAEAAGKEADLEHDLADGEEWCKVGVRSEVNRPREACLICRAEIGWQDGDEDIFVCKPF